MSMEEYQKAYMEGYVAGLERGKAEAKAEEKPFVTVEDIIERYKCGLSKARQILRAVRHVSGGGGLGSSGMVKRSELIYWESLVSKEFLEELSACAAK